MAKATTSRKELLQTHLGMHQTYANYKTHEGALVWSRFSGFIINHTIFIAILAQIIASEGELWDIVNKSFYTVPISLVGFWLGFLWLVSTIRGFESVEFWSIAAVESAEKLKSEHGIQNVYEKGREYFRENREISFNIGNTSRYFMQRSCLTRFFGINTRWTAYLSIGTLLIVYIIIFVLSLVGVFN